MKNAIIVRVAGIHWIACQTEVALVEAEAMANVEPPEIIVRLPSAKSAVWKNRPMMTPKPGKTAHSTFSFKSPKKAMRKTRTVRNTKTLKSELSHHWPLGVVFIY